MIGLTTAHALARYGATVTVFESSRFGGNASLAAGGILAPLKPWEFSPAFIALWLYSLSQWENWLNHLRAYCTIRLADDGIVYVDESAQHSAMQWAQQRNIRGEMLNRQALHQYLPMLNTPSGFLLRDVKQVEVTDLVNALFHCLRSEKVSFVKQSVDLMTDDQSVTGVYSMTESFTADVVVVCAGAWSSKVCTISPQYSIRPKRGQIVQYAGVEIIGKHIVTMGDRYLIPRSGNRLLAGSTVEDCGFDQTATLSAKVALTTFAERLMPGLKHAAVQKQWTGLRPWVNRELPLIGCHPEMSGLFLNTGHFRNGVGLAPGSAALVSALIVGTDPPLNPAHFGLTEQN